MLVGAPFEPFGPSLAAQGLPGERLLCVRAEKPTARLWAAEQALRVYRDKHRSSMMARASAAAVRSRRRSVAS